MKYTKLSSNELIVGNWYSFENWIFKFLRIEQHYLYGTHWCQPEKDYYHDKLRPEREVFGAHDHDVFEIASINDILKMYPNEKIEIPYEIY